MHSHAETHAYIHIHIHISFQIPPPLSLSNIYIYIYIYYFSPSSIFAECGFCSSFFILLCSLFSFKILTLIYNLFFTHCASCIFLNSLFYSVIHSFFSAFI